MHCFSLSISSLAPPHTHVLLFFDPDTYIIVFYSKKVYNQPIRLHMIDLGFNQYARSL